MDIPLDILNAGMAFGIALIGSLLQGSIGFGLGLVCVPLLVLIDPVFVPGPLLLSALFLNLLISSRELRSIDIRGLKWAIPGRILGAILGAALLTVIPQKNLSLLFGSMVILAVIIIFAGFDLPPHPWNVFGAGTFSGFMGTTASIGGAPMALVYQRKKGPRIRGTLAAIFIFGTIISIASLAFIGSFGLREIQAALLLFPGNIIGFFLSNRTARILDRGFIRPAVLAASSLSGIIVILRNIL
jgi:hypothetical protein